MCPRLSPASSERPQPPSPGHTGCALGSLGGSPTSGGGEGRGGV